MKVKFKLEVKKQGNEDTWYFVNGTATNAQVDEMLDFLLKIKSRDALAELESANAVL